MPSYSSGSNTSQYYSFNYGVMHVIAVNTEVCHPLVQTRILLLSCFNPFHKKLMDSRRPFKGWLIFLQTAFNFVGLKMTSKSPIFPRIMLSDHGLHLHGYRHNVAARIIVIAHRPFYCSVSSAHDSCVVGATYFRSWQQHDYHDLIACRVLRGLVQPI